MKKLLYIILFVPFLSFSQSLLLQENSSLSLATNSSSVSLSNGFGFTLEVWYTPQPSQWQEQIVGSMNHGFYGPNGCDYSTSGIGFWHSGGTLYAEVNDGVNVYSISSSNYITNQWTHLAMTYDGEKFKFFINGILEESQSIDMFPFIMGDLLINFHSWCGGASSRIDGARIDELRLSSIPRYTNDFSPQLYNFNNDEFTLGLWHFDSDSGDSPFPSCQDTLALNYSTTNNNPDTLCIYGIPGCTDINAFNFDPIANYDNGSCISQEEYTIDSLQAELDNLNNDATTSISSLQQALDNWNTTIDLSAGWNIFGYGCPSSIDVADGLSNHTERIIITKDNNGNVYMPEFGFNGIGDFTPGYGYQIKLTEAIEGFSLCDWYVNDIPEDNIVSLQEENFSIQNENDSLQAELFCYENPQVGDNCFGGIIFYIYPEYPKHGLVASQNDIEGLFEWGCLGIDVNGANEYIIGSGLQNTLDIVNQDCSTVNGGVTSAIAAINYESGGYNDWYLPSIDELNLMISTIGQGFLGNIGEFELSNWPIYSSSTESNYNHALNNSENTSTHDKDELIRVRPIRSF